MKHMNKTGKFVAICLICCSFFSAYFFCSIASAEEGKKLTSFATGFFYVTKSMDDGIIQVTDCADLKGAPAASRYKSSTCVQDNRGFRCTTKESLDVVFVFKDKKECLEDRKKTMASEEE